MSILKIIIVEDEKRIRASLRNILSLHFPEGEVIAEAGDVNSAIDVIKQLSPDVVLLDIKIGGGSGFDILRKLMPVDFKVIFITAFDEYAVQAFRFSAMDYLLKPVIPEELVKALNLVRSQKETDARLKILLHNKEHSSHELKKVVLNSHDKIDVIDVNQIIRCEADGNYTHFTIHDRKGIISSRPLKEYEEMLVPYGFFRSHHSHLINLAYIERLEKKDGGKLIMKDGSVALVSARRYSDLVSAINQL